MRRLRHPRALLWLVLVLAAAGTLSVRPWDPGVAGAARVAAPAHHLPGGFRNLNPEFAPPSAWVRVRSWARRIGPVLRGEHAVAALPVAPVSGRALAGRPGEATVTWVGHATVLVQLDGQSFLTDPHWGDRAGPFGGLVGAARYTPPGVAFERLPPIDFVLISHDHYDHLDEATVERLARAHAPRFIVPLGMKAWLEERGIGNVTELDWGESTRVGGLTIVCTPAQHFSGRTPLDQGRRLWASWVVLGSRRFYFAGDSGYYRHFRDIGAAFGPFDLAALPIGSYEPRETTRPVHTSPEEALQAWLDLRARRLVGIHWGTFALVHERYDEPPRRLLAEAERRGVARESIWTLRPGETRSW
jgi:L-ascorbate metabolism protein UlaG (beta-lactamase superfamily)